MNNEQELNKKLAEWAGWKVNGSDEGTHWYEDAQGHPVNPPNFPTSLDACFKWLVPKLLNENTFPQLDEIVITPFEGWTTRLNYHSLHDDGFVERETVSITENNPALALCLAIEKLINSEIK